MLMPILTAVATLGGLGLLFGLVLGIASKIFYIESDPRIALVRECLPGANCGACGFAGCDALSAAIVAGDAPVNQCPVGGAAVGEKVAAVMGVEAGASTKMVAIVRCNGTEGTCLKKYDYYGADDCRQAAAVLGGDKACEYGCLGLGSCTKVCQYGAISVNDDGVAVVNPELCTSCGLCVKTCPKAIIALVPYDKQVEALCSNKGKGKSVKDSCKVGCITCNLCKKNCPSEAIEMVDNLPAIDAEKCTHCGTCIEKCPQNVIHDLKKGPVSLASDKAAD